MGIFCSCFRGAELDDESDVVERHLQAYSLFASLQHDLTYKAHADSAVVNLGTYDILTTYLGGIASKLRQLVLLQNGKQMVQEGASTSVADSPQEQIQKYYDAVMPNLKAILINFDDKPNRMLRAKAIECISLAAVAVGKDKFRDDAKQVIEVLMYMQDDQMETDDPTTRYMLQAWARLCKCMGQDFLPCMAVVMPPLLRSAQLKPYMIIQSVYPYYEEFEALDKSMKVITLGDNIIKIKTSVLEEKATACNVLCCYVDELKEGFFPWIDQVASILVPLLKFYFHKEVRKAAVSAMPDLLRYSELAIEKGLAQRSDGNLEQLPGNITSTLVDALLNEPDSEISANMLDALNKCLEVRRRVCRAGPRGGRRPTA